MIDIWENFMTISLGNKLGIIGLILTITFFIYNEIKSRNDRQLFLDKLILPDFSDYNNMLSNSKKYKYLENKTYDVSQYLAQLDMSNKRYYKAFKNLYKRHKVDVAVFKDESNPKKVILVPLIIKGLYPPDLRESSKNIALSAVKMAILK